MVRPSTTVAMVNIPRLALVALVLAGCSAAETDDGLSDSVALSPREASIGLAATAASEELDAKCVRRGPVAGDYVDVCARLYLTYGMYYSAYGAMQSNNADVHLQLDQVFLYTDKDGYLFVMPPLNGRSYIHEQTQSLTVSRDTNVYACAYYSIRWRTGMLTTGNTCAAGHSGS